MISIKSNEYYETLAQYLGRRYVPGTQIFHAREFDPDKPLLHQIAIEPIFAARPYKAQKWVVIPSRYVSAILRRAI